MNYSPSLNREEVRWGLAKIYKPTTPSHRVNQSRDQTESSIAISIGNTRESKSVKTHSRTQSPFGAKIETIPITPANIHAKL